MDEQPKDSARSAGVARLILPATPSGIVGPSWAGGPPLSSHEARMISRSDQPVLVTELPTGPRLANFPQRLAPLLNTRKDFGGTLRWGSLNGKDDASRRLDVGLPQLCEIHDIQ